MSNVIIDDANLSNIANAIREKNGSTDTYKPADMPQAILDLSSGGGTDEQYTVLQNYMSNLKLDKGSNKGVINLDCSKFSALTSLRQTFNSNSSLTTLYLSNTEKITDWYGCFFTVNNLFYIYGDIDMSSATNVQSAFQATRLTTVSFVPNTIKISITFNSTHLSAESIQSIIDGLATVETQQKLTLHTDVVLKLTAEQHNQIADKNWIIG